MSILSAIWFWIKENTRLATAGGSWAKAVPHSIQTNLRWFFLDGVLGASLDGIVAPFLSLYLLALGATSGQIELMTSLAGLGATLVLLPGAMLSERSGKRKLIFVLWAGFNLASFNVLLSLAPSEKRARYAALFQVAVALSSATGTFVGSLIVSRWGFIPVFAISGIGRFIGIAYFARFVLQKDEGWDFVADFMSGAHPKG